MHCIQQISRGDMEAMAQIYEQHKVWVYRLALSLLGDVYLAEDVTQETFLHVWEKASSYREEISETAWIAAIARNLSYDFLRKRSREVTDDWEQNGEETSRLAQALARKSEENADEGSDLYYLDLISGLEREEQEIVNLRIVADLPWKEIGKITGGRADACRKRYRRALKKLQAGMEGSRI